MGANDLYEELCQLERKAELLGSCGSVLSWDEQTYMPNGGADHRASQMAVLAGLHHERRIHPRLGELISELEHSEFCADLESPQAANLREARRQFDRATKLPKVLVEELSRTTTLAQQAWIKARKESSFSQFLPWLERMIALKREESSLIGARSGHLYDVLLDDYEPGVTCQEISAVFGPLREALVPLVRAIQASGRVAPVDIVSRQYPVAQQHEFVSGIARRIGFDFDRGRIDESTHPFCSGFGPGDCRLTTRYDERHFNSAFFGVLHEAGHGMYEQGLCAESYGLATGQACSLGIHESQSRLWENFVGRSLSFWEYLFPSAQKSFPAALQNVSLGEFYFAINDVRPSFIRVESDEVTYNLHIMLRFELEQHLIAGTLEPADLPDAWNQLFQASFGLTPPDAARGCLQDIHWSCGLLGYFPTYTLGNMYAAELMEAAARDLGNLDDQFRRGEFMPLKEWLNTNIHAHGKRFPAGKLVERVTGQPFSHEPLIRHLTSRFAPLYGL